MLAVMNKKWITRWLIGLILLISTHRIELTSDHQTIPEKPIVIIVPSFNNRDWYKKNLDSLLKQQYRNYRIIYIADGADEPNADGTAELVARYLKQQDRQHRVTLIRNAKRCGALANIYHAIHTCKDHEIAVVCDGDDWFKHDRVLRTINAAYQDPHVWLTYGQFERYPYGKKGYCKEFPREIIEHNAYRDYDWVSSHVRTCYVKLFKKIKLKDLIENGDFFDVTGDQAVMFPMLEMARGNHRCIDEILYVYNSASPLNDYKIKLLRQMHYEKVIRSKTRYEKIVDLFQQTEIAQPAIVMISENRPAYAYAFLETVAKYCSSIGPVTLLYRADSLAMQQSYEAISAEFPTVECIHCSKTNFKQTLQEITHNIATSHVLCACDGVIIKDFMNLQQCAQLLEATQAYGVYLALGKHICENRALNREQKIPPACLIEEGVYGFQFKQGEGDWRKPNSFSGVLMQTGVLQNLIQEINCSTLPELDAALDKQLVDFDNVGIFFDESKVVIVHDDEQLITRGSMLDDATRMFNEGKKIDTVPLFKLANQAVEIVYNSSYVER